MSQFVKSLRFASGFPSLAAASIAVAAIAFASNPASAEMVLSQIVVDMMPDEPVRDDIEVFNSSSERMYVVVEPSRIIDPGLSGETRTQSPDPDELGLLVSPNRLVLEPGQRKLVRLAAVTGRSETDRIYRVTIRPVVGELVAPQSALKVLLGYDALVIVRPANLDPSISVSQEDRSVIFRNDGNTNVEIFDVRRCDASGACIDLPGKRLYAGAEWQQLLPTNAPVEFRAMAGDRIIR